MYLIEWMNINQGKDATVTCLYFISKTDSEEIWITFLDYSIFWKIIDIPKKISEMEQKLQLSDTVLNWLKLLKLECLVLLIAHISGCIFIRIALSEQEAGRQSWMSTYNYESNAIQEQYLISAYFMIITMTTTGYGDISPQTLYEKAFILVMALVSQNVVGYSFTTISDIVKTQGDKQKEFKTYMREISKEMNNRNMNILLQHKVSKYLEYQYMENVRKQSSETNILEILPDLLKEEVLLDINKEMINHIDYLSKLSHESQREIALQIKQKVFFPGEIIFKEGGYNNNIYYINQGTVVISIPIATKNEKSKNQPEMNIQTLKKQDVFGLQGFHFQHKSPYTVRTTEVTVLSYLNQKQFQLIVQKNRDDFEKWAELRDRIFFNQEYCLIKMKCISCGDFNHSLDTCPYINLKKSYVPKDIEKSLYQRDKQSQEDGNTQLKQNDQGIQKRSQCQRREKWKFQIPPDFQMEIAIDVIAGLNQSVISDAISVIHQESQVNPIEDNQKKLEQQNTHYSIGEKHNTESFQKQKIERSYQTRPSYPFKNQQTQQQSTIESELKEKQQGLQYLKHTQSVEMIKIDKLDVIKENESENNLLIASTITKNKPEKQQNQIEQEYQQYQPFFGNEIILDFYNEMQEKKQESMMNNLQLKQLQEKFNSDQNLMNRKNKTKELSNISIDFPNFTNQKSRDSVLNSIDLLIQANNLQFLKNEEKKFVTGDEIYQQTPPHSSQMNDTQSYDKKLQISNPKQNEAALDQLMWIEPLSGSKKKKQISQQGLLFKQNRQNTMKRQTYIRNQQSVPLIPLRDESCELQTEKEIDKIYTPQNVSLYSKIHQKRVTESQSSQTQIEQEIFKRKEDKRQSLMYQMINDSLSTSQRNIPHTNNKRNTYLRISTSEQSAAQTNIPAQSNLPIITKKIIMKAQSPKQRHERNQQYTIIQDQKGQDSLQSRQNNKKDSFLLTRNNSHKLIMQLLQPYQVQHQEMKHYLDHNYTSFGSQRSLHPLDNIYLQQDTIRDNSIGNKSIHHSQSQQDIKSKFKQFNQINNDLESIIKRNQVNQEKQHFPRLQSSKNITFIQPNKIEQMHELKEELENESKEASFKQNVEYQIRCLKGLQNLDLLVLRKFYILSQQKNQLLDEIGREEEYILISDNELDIDQIKNYTHYFPECNFVQIKKKYRRKMTNKTMMLTKKSRRTQQVSKQQIATMPNYK